jgi:hypothetical protein
MNTKPYRLAPRRHKYRLGGSYVCVKCNERYGRGRMITPTRCDKCRGVDTESTMKINARQNFLMEYLLTIAKRMATLEKIMRQEGTSPSVYGADENQLEWKILRFRENRIKQMLGMKNILSQGMRSRAGEASRMLNEIKEMKFRMTMKIKMP